jgi:putative oxidoreductase
VTANACVLLAARILLGALFLVAGVRAAIGYPGTVGYMAALGFPLPAAAAALSIAIEIGGAILLMIGWRTRWAAGLLALFVLVATLSAHRFGELGATQYNNQLHHFFKNLSIIGGFLMVAACGPGPISLDKR